MIVRCCQTNKQYTIKVKDLSLEKLMMNLLLTNIILFTNAKLMMTYRGKLYAVQFVQFKGISYFSTEFPGVKIANGRKRGRAIDKAKV